MCKIYDVREVIKMNEQTKIKTDRSDRPAYVTRRGRLLWYDAEGRYSFCEIAGLRVLVTIEGKFHCFDNDKKS